MPENRFFLEKPFKKKEHYILESPDELHHLKVMRKKVGDDLELVNGQNQLANATITQIEKHSATALLTHVETTPPPKQKVILAQALLRSKNLDLVIEKGTELGATSFWLFPGDRSEKKALSQTQLKRLRHLTISSLKQSGRLDLPSIKLLPPLPEWSQKPQNSYFGDLEAKAPLTPTSAASITLIIGPEKGFSSQEKTLLRSYAKGIRLNPNTLRAETAAITALAIQFNYF